MLKVEVKLETCNDCKYLSHTGAFTRGGAKPCCDHNTTVALKGDDCFKRVIKHMQKIPVWCPLRNEGKY